MKWIPLAVLLALASCSGAADAGWRTVAEPARTPAQAAQLQRAAGAKEALFQALLGELTRTLAEGGPAAAIGVCRDAAPRLAQEVGAQQGLRIGRTSEKLRNPKNTPPAWAAPRLAEARTGPLTAAHEDGRLGALFPIRLAAPCLACHGQADALAPGVRDALARSYPSDRATGYAEGDLRGWFWVEVP